MTDKIDKVLNILEKMEKVYHVPSAYLEFEELPKTDAYIAYYEREPEQFGADNIMYYSEKNFIIELYTKKYDPVLEKNLTDLFEEQELYWSKGTQTTVDSENIMMSAFYI